MGEQLPSGQAERDAERIAELEAEGERLRRLTGAQAERSAENLARAEAAEEQIAAVRALLDTWGRVQAENARVLTDMAGIGMVTPIDPVGGLRAVLDGESGEEK